MISNERPSPYGNNRSFGYRPYNPGIPKPHVEEDVLKTETIQIEKKKFTITLKENPRGRFLRITEEANGRRANVIIPATGLEEVRKIIHDMVQTSAELPLKEIPAE